MCNKQAIALIRVSTDNQDAEPQLNRIKHWAELEHFDIVQSYGFTTTGESATLPVCKREAEKAISHAINLQCLLIADAWDRISRDIPESHLTARRVLAEGSNIYCIANNMNVREWHKTATGKLMFGVVVLFAAHERNQTSERTRKKAQDSKQTNYRAGQIPYGMMQDPTRPEVKTVNKTEITYYPHLIPCPAEQAVLDRIKALHEQYDGSYATIADSLQAEGMLNRRGKPFTRSAVAQMLKQTEQKEK